ncbi:hypothetical protein [Bacillus seohaeanensis]|uniref:Bacteriocin n=1 Tax=Bacillus seohaeanensis TaxID=284580 RepID=A0ABW5RSP3_9BACI
MDNVKLGMLILGGVINLVKFYVDYALPFFKKRKEKRNNPPSCGGKTDRNVS